MHAASCGDVESTRQLLLKSPALNVQNSYGRTALMIAVERGHREVVELLLAAGADAKVIDIEGFTASHHAHEMGQLEIAKTLFNHQNASGH
jgi:uncharacterized protein